MSYRLTRRAAADVIAIHCHGAARFGTAQADAYHDRLERAFALLAIHPYLARERTELVPPVRVHPVGAHVIVYRVEADGAVLIVRVRHGHEDWQSDPA